MTTSDTGRDERAPQVETSASGSSRVAAWSASLLMFAALVDSQVVAAIAPQVAAGLGTLPARVAASVTVYAVAAACVALLLGRWGRSVRPVAWLPVAALVFIAANVVAAFAPNVAIFWAARSAAGVAGGLVSALVIAALADASSYARRGRQMSGVAVSYFLAPVIGVPVGAWLAGRAGWRADFLVTAALVAVAGLLVRQFPLAQPARDNNDAAARDGDAKGQIKERPSLWRLVMQTRSTRRGVASAFFVSGGLVCLTTYLATWLADAFAAKASEVAIFYAVAGAGAVAGGALGGVLADRFGKRRVAVWASLWMALCVLLVATFNRGALLYAVIGATAFLAALRIAPLQALITELVAARERARYVALRNASSQLGIALAVVAGARAYQGWGLFGVGLLSSALTLCAWLSLRRIADPHARDEQGSDRPHDAQKVDRSRDTQGVDRGRDVQVDNSRGRRVVRKLAGALVALLLVVCLVLPWLLSFAITKAKTRCEPMPAGALFPCESRRTDTPAAQGATFEDVSFTTADGIKLTGWYLPARAQRLTVVMTHGLFRSRYETLDRGVRLWRAGYGVLLYDMRRHGHSTGEFSSIGYYERRDVEAALKFVEGREPQNQIVLFGVSMGAAATLLAAAETQDDARVAGVVSESSFTSFADTARHHIKDLTPIPAFPFVPLLIDFTSWRMNFRAADFDVLAAVRKIRQPILFIGSGADKRMPNGTVLQPLYDAATNPLKRKLVVAGATHGKAFDTSPDEYMNALVGFLQLVESAPDASR